MAGKRTSWIAAALVAAAVGAGFARRQRARLEAAWQEWRYPVPKGPAVSPLGEEILRRQGAEEMSRFLKEYQRVKAEVDEAQDKGADVGVLTGRLKDSTILAREGRFRLAFSMLNRAEMGLPKPKPAAFPASGEPDPGERVEIEGRPVRP